MWKRIPHATAAPTASSSPSHSSYIKMKFFQGKFHTIFCITKYICYIMCVLYRTYLHHQKYINDRVSRHHLWDGIESQFAYPPKIINALNLPMPIQYNSTFILPSYMMLLTSRLSNIIVYRVDYIVSWYAAQCSKNGKIVD